ncbi:MAG: hypothetical protein WCL39_08505 [Armatimonadota bacterium]
MTTRHLTRAIALGIATVIFAAVWFHLSVGPHGVSYEFSAAPEKHVSTGTPGKAVELLDAHALNEVGLDALAVGRVGSGERDFALDLFQMKSGKVTRLLGPERWGEVVYEAPKALVPASDGSAAALITGGVSPHDPEPVPGPHNSLWLIDTQAGTLTGLGFQTRRICAAAWDSKSSTLAALAIGKTVWLEIYNKHTPKQHYDIALPGAGATTLTFDPEGHKVFVGLSEPTRRLVQVDLKTRAVQTIAPLSGVATSMTVSADRKELIIGSDLEIVSFTLPLRAHRTLLLTIPDPEGETLAREQWQSPISQDPRSNTLFYLVHSGTAEKPPSPQLSLWRIGLSNRKSSLLTVIDDGSPGPPYETVSTIQLVRRRDKVILRRLYFENYPDVSSSEIVQCDRKGCQIVFTSPAVDIAVWQH